MYMLQNFTIVKITPSVSAKTLKVPKRIAQTHVVSTTATIFLKTYIAILCNTVAIFSYGSSGKGEGGGSHIYHPPIHMFNGVTKL